LPLPLRFFRWTSFFSLLFPTIPGQVAGPAASRVLEAKWEFRAVSNTDRAELNDWHPAEVPGVVQTDLLRDGLIPDLFYQDNDTRLQWIGPIDWQYRTTFQADSLAPAGFFRQGADGENTGRAGARAIQRGIFHFGSERAAGER
jgi:hypothetical protein